MAEPFVSDLDARGSILVVDDDEDTRDLLAAALSTRGNRVFTAKDGSTALDIAREKALDAAVVDVQLGDEDGIVLVRRLLEVQTDLPVVMVTGHGNIDVAIQSLRAGAYDFVAKPVVMDDLARTLGAAVARRQLRSEVVRLRQRVDEDRGVDGILGDSHPIRKVRELIRQVAGSDANVLVTGESGTGKELVARSLHQQSDRRGQPFVAINCAAMTPTLLESELFGHVKGAFTDARRDRPGLFAQASRGTLFLDEIGEMPLDMQVKLLRVLQERKVRPVGGDEEIEFDVRLITATNRDLEAEVDQDRFRSDLFYRINVVHVEVPPLRARAGDVLLLARHFLAANAKRSGKPIPELAPAVARKLTYYDWPGNVRELENAMERAVAVSRDEAIELEGLPPKVRDFVSTKLVLADGNNPEEMPPLEEVERRYVGRVIAACSGNKTRAAQVLGLDRRTLYRRIETLGIKT